MSAGLPDYHADEMIERVMFACDQLEHSWRVERRATVATLRRIARVLDSYADRLEEEPPQRARLRIVR